MLREAELRWLENGEARLLAGATGRHPAGVADMRSPRGAACLTWSDAYARGGRRKPAREVGWAKAKAWCGVDRWAGFGWRARSEAAARERRETIFQILFSRNFQISVFKYPFEQENDFF